jgi:transposase
MDDDRIHRLEALIKSQAATIVRLEAEIAELKRRLGLNSGNSGKPPSSDTFRKKPAPKSLRERGKNPSGGRAGQKSTTLMQVENPDETIAHAAACCGECGLSLSERSTVSLTKRQVFDIAPPQVTVTEHRVMTKLCSCGHVNGAEFPEEIKAPAQYGKRVKDLAVYFSVQQLIPEDRIRETFSDVFGLPLATDTIVKAVNDAAAELKPVQDKILEKLKACEIKHLDETGLRIGGKLHWLQSICNGLMTHYRATAKRKDLLEGVKGTIVHDCFKPYFTMEGVEHALCNAHILRELNGLIENGSREEGIWARGMQRFLRVCCRYGAVITEAVRDKARCVYDKIVTKGAVLYASLPALAAGRRGRVPKRTGENLLVRLIDFKEPVLRFLDGKTPFTNNLAEQSVRMVKVKQKISGGFRTMTGAESFCTVRGFISTAKKQGLNVLSALQNRSFA